MLTRTTASRAAKAKISAHETTPGHTDSIWLLITSMTSNPRRLRFASAVLSVLGPEISTEASQPWTKQSLKSNFSMAGAIFGCKRKEAFMVAWTIDSARGHALE